MLALVYKKISKNKWMFLSMLIGFILSTAMLSSIPIYTQSITQKLLIKDMEKYQKDKGIYPGSYNLKASLHMFYGSNNISQDFEKLNSNIENNILSKIKLPTIANCNKLDADFFSVYFNDNPDNKMQMNLFATSGIEDHVSLTHGKMFSSKKENNVIEVIATEQAMQNYQFILDKEYTIHCNMEDDFQPFKIKVVGVFKNKYSNDSFWNNGPEEYDQGIVMNYTTFKDEFLSTKIAHFIDATWYRAYDYHKINTENVNSIMENMLYVEAWSNSIANDKHINALDILNSYNSRQKVLKTNLLVLETPVIIMLCYYLFMISQLIIEQDKKEIAVLKSRGANRLQILQIYLLQGLILSGIALIVGPPLGLLLCNIIGSSNGFMDFVQRSALTLNLNLSAYIYSFLACIIFTSTMLIPAFIASKTTIVQHSRENGKVNKKPFFQRYYLDVILLAVSSGGYYSYKSVQKILNVTGVGGTDIPLNPFLFTLGSVLIFSLAFLFTRIFPYAIRLLLKIREKRWNPAIYSLLINLSRSGGKNNFLIVFLILTVSTGIFSSISARTINTNIEEREKYAVGADITVMAKWTHQVSTEPTSGPGSDSAPVYETIEPDYKLFSSLSGIESTTKVIKLSNLSFSNSAETSGISSNSYGKSPQGQNTIDVMGIIPNEFGKIAWFRTDLLKYHWYNYLNLLTKYPNGVLVSSNFAKKNGLKQGDEFSISIKTGEAFSGTILATIDYWPSYNPFISDDDHSGNLVVANFNYVQATLPLTPYEVWMKKKPNASSAQIYNDIKAKGLEILTLKDSSQNIIEEKNDPIVQGTNGALTLDFIVNLLVTLAGFIIFWILNIKSRTYQFGILRAMGLFSREVIAMIFGELLLLSGSSIIIGVLIGGISSKLFIPLLQITGNAAQYVPPLKAMENINDSIKLYSALFLMIITGLIVLRRIVSKININQAIKLGED